MRSSSAKQSENWDVSLQLEEFNCILNQAFFLIWPPGVIMLSFGVEYSYQCLGLMVSCVMCNFSLFSKERQFLFLAD